MTMRRLICAVAILCCASAAALADGTVFVQGIAKPRIPDQSALITFDGKTERLVIETAVEGEGTEFAWVVPLPSLPKVEAATPGLFPTLRAITGPRVVEYETDWPVLPVLGLVFGLLIWVVIYTRRMTMALAIFLIALFLASLLLPVFVRARESGFGSQPSISKGVNVLDRKTVGLYETATISGADGKKVAEWLNSNGFKCGESVQEALTQYAKEGWMFVAARIRRDSAEAGRFSPHPLSFTFSASRAVYPLRLTGIENGPLAVDMYAVGDAEAVAGPFVRQRVARLDFPPPDDRDYFIPIQDRDDSIRISHEALQSYTKGFSAITLLSATLRPEQMKADVYLTWKPLAPFRHVYYLRNAARAWASQAAAASFVLLSLICSILYCRWKCLLSVAVSFMLAESITGGFLLMASSDTSPYAFPVGLLMAVGSIVMLILVFRYAAKYDRQRRELPRTSPSIRAVMITALAPILLGACVYAVLPKLPDARVLKVNWALNELDHMVTLQQLDDMATNNSPAAALAAYRKEAASIFAGLREHYATSEYGTNYMREFPYIEEDSPGNYVIELKAGKPTYFYFDDNGRKIELGVIGERVRGKSGE